MRLRLSASELVILPFDLSASIWPIALARIASNNYAPIHCRYDTAEVLSMEQLQRDTAFIAEFVRRMACAAVCPVAREIPEKVRQELDEYLWRKRKKE